MAFILTDSTSTSPNVSSQTRDIEGPSDALYGGTLSIGSLGFTY